MHILQTYILRLGAKEEPDERGLLTSMHPSLFFQYSLFIGVD